MSQVFQVLRCYKCLVFQVHQTRKDNKWSCKMCGEKQSVKRHYGIGTAKDCRIHVQKLNKMRGENELAVSAKIDSDDSEYDENDGVGNNINSLINVNKNKVKESKWSLYVEKQEVHEVKEPLNLNKRENVLKISQKRKMYKTFKQSKKLKIPNENEEQNECDMYSQLENQIELAEGCIVNTSDSSNLDFKITPSTICNNLKVVNQINKNSLSHMKTPLRLQTYNKESKWVQFIDTENNVDENYEGDGDKGDKYSNRPSLFSLCDDSEIDTILDL